MRLLATLVLCLLAFTASAEEHQPVVPTGQTFQLPTTFHLVNDHTGMLPPSMEIRLGRKLDALSQKNGTRIVVITIPSAGPEGMEAYTQRAFLDSGLGEGEGNGALFMIEGETGQFYIRTGGGLAGVMPDIWMRQMIDKTITPLWNPEHYLEGLEAGIDAMIARAGGEETKPTTFDKISFVQDRKLLSWVSLGILLALYGLACTVWRFGFRRPLPQLRVHAGIACAVAVLAAGIAIYPDPLAELMKNRAASKGDFQIPTLDRHPHSPAQLASPGHISVIVITYEQLAKESSLEMQLRDLARMRPDIAVRMAYLGFDGWNTGELRHLFGQDMAIMPYIMIYGADGKLIKADEGTDRRASELLDRWHIQEAYREAGILSST